MLQARHSRVDEKPFTSNHLGEVLRLVLENDDGRLMEQWPLALKDKSSVLLSSLNNSNTTLSTLQRIVEGYRTKLKIHFPIESVEDKENQRSSTAPATLEAGACE